MPLLKSFILISVFIWSIPLLSQPNANFTIDRYNICSGTSLALTSQSTNANAYEWKIEGIHYSYSQDTIVTLIEACYDLKEIRLIARDTLSGVSDSSAVVVEVFDECSFHWTGDFLMCAGDTVTLAGSPEDIATQYVITPPHTLLNGCFTCPSIEFILQNNNVFVDKTSTYFGGCTETTSYHYFCGFLGNKEILVEKIKIFPNPSAGLLSIESGDKILNIWVNNLFGQTIFRQSGLNNYKIGLDLSNVTPGIYIVNIEIDSAKIVTRKIVKQ